LIEDKKPKFFYGYIIVLAAFCIMVANAGTVSTFGVFVKPLLTEFGWTRALISGASSLQRFLASLVGIGAGRLTDRFGPRPLATACGLFLGLGFFLMSRISTIWQLYLVYGVILGIGTSGFLVPIISTIPRWFVKRRGTMTAIVLSGFSIGSMIMPPLTARLIITYGWRTSCIILGIIALIVITLAAQFLRRDPGRMGQLPYGADEVKTEESRLLTEGFSLRQAIRTRQFWILCGIFSCLFFSLSVMFVHIVIHAIDLGISAISAANILAILAGVGTASRIISGSAADRIGHKPVLVIGFSLLLASLLWLLVAQELWALYLFAVIFGFGFFGAANLESPLTAKLFGLGSLGIILGGVEFVSVTLSMASPILVGYIFDVTGSYQPAFLTCVIVGTIVVILTLLLSPIRSEQESK